jgi:TetR/AcrR family transcriptional regulator, transcriptional repressor for nem operon
VRISKLQAQNHRRAITDVSARLMRERGIDGVSVADLMGAAGLTHGGFYGHFESKEQLAAEACTHAFTQSVERWKTRIAAHPDRNAALRALTEAYLSTRTRDNPGTSCPTAALVCDVARERTDTPVRAAFLSGTQQLIEVLASLQPGGDLERARRKALAQFSTLVGAVVLARATAGAAMSDEILRAAREELAESLGGAAASTPAPPPDA